MQINLGGGRVEPDYKCRLALLQHFVCHHMHEDGHIHIHDEALYAHADTIAALKNAIIEEIDEGLMQGEDNVLTARDGCGSHAYSYAAALVDKLALTAGVGP